jgi:hypothetical protein
MDLAFNERSNNQSMFTITSDSGGVVLPMQDDFREETNDAIDFNTHRETDSYFLIEKYERLSVVVKSKHI